MDEMKGAGEASRQMESWTVRQKRGEMSFWQQRPTSLSAEVVAKRRFSNILLNKFKNICIWLPVHACVMCPCACVRSVSTATGSCLSSAAFDMSV